MLFLPGCNFSCPYCHNPDLVRRVDENSLAGFTEILEHVRKRKGMISACVISGGEPLLHPKVPDLVRALRAEGMLVKLDTNGSFPDRIEQAGADYVAMDIKCSLEDYAKLWPSAPADYAARIGESIRIVRSLGTANEFRITCAPGFVTAQSMAAIADLLLPQDQVYLQPYRPGRVLDEGWAADAQAPTGDTMQILLEIVRLRAPKAKIRASS